MASDPSRVRVRVRVRDWVGLRVTVEECDLSMVAHTQSMVALTQSMVSHTQSMMEECDLGSTTQQFERSRLRRDLPRWSRGVA